MSTKPPRGHVCAALERAIAAVDGVGALALLLKVTSSTPSMWKSRGKVPAEYCPSIERVTRERGNVVTCEELCPDVEWWVLRGLAAKRGG